MVTCIRHCFALGDLRAARGNVPDRARRLATRASRILGGALLTAIIFGGTPALRPAQAATQPPIGYERWTDPNADSDVDFGQTVEQVYQKYSAPLLIGMPQTEPQKDKRLIDIEVRADDSGLANYVYDIVWVKNEGAFQLDSWFVPAMDEAELQMLPQLASQGIVALDIERYPKGNEWRYAVILQRNAGLFGWELLTDASLEQVLETAEHRGLRLVDLDYAVPGPLDCPTVQGQACTEATFDAILVANSGSNAVETRLWFNMSLEAIAAKQAQGYQVIDREDVPEGVVTVWVKSGLPFALESTLSQDEVIFEHGHHGRLVDLEHGWNPYSIVNFAGSGAPVTIGLATTQQPTTDAGRIQSQQNDRPTAERVERDPKPKDRKATRQGKNGKRDNGGGS